MCSFVVLVMPDILYVFANREYVLFSVERIHYRINEHIHTFFLEIQKSCITYTLSFR